MEPAIKAVIKYEHRHGRVCHVWTLINHSSIERLGQLVWVPSHIYDILREPADFPSLQKENHQTPFPEELV